MAGWFGYIGKEEKLQEKERKGVALVVVVEVGKQRETGERAPTNWHVSRSFASYYKRKIQVKILE